MSTGIYPYEREICLSCPLAACDDTSPQCPLNAGKRRKRPKAPDARLEAKRAYDRAYYHANKKQIMAKRDLQKGREAALAYYYAHREEILAKKKAERVQVPEESQEAYRAYFRVYLREWRARRKQQDVSKA